MRRLVSVAGALCLCWGTSSAQADREACLTAHEEGQLLRLRGQYEAARDQLAACASWTCPKVISQDCTALLADLEAVRPTIVLRVSAPDGSPITDVRVLADDRLVTARADGRPVQIDRGTHALWFEAPGYQPREHVLVVRDGEKNEVVSVQLDPLGASPEGARDARQTEAVPVDAQHTQRKRELLAYALGGSAVAVLMTGVGLGVSGRRNLDRLEHRCADEPCERDQTDRGRRLYIGADIAFGVGGALALAATWLYVSKFFEDPPGAWRAGATRFDARVDRGGAAVLVRTAF